jgi:GT2 family glycosyltransferase
MTPDISVVIVSWNNARELPACLEAVAASAAFAATRVQLLAVDNASTDASRDVLRNAGAITVENRVNIGFPAAVCQALSFVESPWALTLNADVTVALPFFDRLVRAIRTVPVDVAALVPTLRFSGDPYVVNSAGIGFDEAGIPYEITAIGPAPAGGSGGACAYRVAALDEVGGFEPAFFAYLEDADLAWRLDASGFRAERVVDAVGYHLGSVSTGERSRIKATLVARNRILFFRIHRAANARMKLWRGIVEAGHMTTQTVFLRNAAPMRARILPWRLRRYAAELARSDRPLRGYTQRRATLLQTLKRKRRARRHFGRAGGAG